MVATLALAGPNGTTQVQSGTVVVVAYSNTKVIVAADSREVNREGMYRDEACKISVLSDQIIFSAAGSARAVSAEGVPRWDAAAEARIALTVTEPSLGDNRGDLLDRVAARWGLMLTEKISQNMAPADADLADGQTVIDGIFAGVDGVGAMHISHQRVKVRRDPGGPPQLSVEPTKVITLSDATQFGALGEADVFNEFMNAKTKRAKQWKRRINRESHGIDRDLAQSIRLVELTGTYGAETIRQNPAIHLVGGETDAARLLPNGKVEWIRRKRNCPQN